MYIQAIWMADDNSSTIANLVEIPDWKTAGAKLSDAYPGYYLKNMNLINLAVDKVDTRGNAWLCRYDNGKDNPTTAYLFCDSFQTANQILLDFGFRPISIAQTNLTYKQETPG